MKTNKIKQCSMVAFAFTMVMYSSNTMANTQLEVKRIVVDEAIKHNFSPALALAVTRVESDFDDRARSSKGARGIMQIMPMTAKTEFGVDAKQLWDARLNSRVGIQYLQKLIDRYGKLDLALSHYNGGTLSCQRGGCIAHPYTRKYVADVFKWKKHYEEQAYVWNVKSKHGIEQDTQIVVKEVPEPELLVQPSMVNDISPIRKPRVKRIVQSSSRHLELMQERRLRISRSLDDFTPFVRWSH